MDLYLKSLQLILRHQLYYLIHKKHLPSEIEIVVQDLWSVRISQIVDKFDEENQEMHSSQGFGTETSDSETEAEHDSLSVKTRDKKLKQNPTLIDCLALCYLGAVTLRLPVTPGDIRTWTIEEEMPYWNAIRLIPPTMRNGLLPSLQSSLQPNSLLSLKRFYASLTGLQVAFEKKFSIAWPPLNVPVLLFRYLKDLALPLELYSATIRLGEIQGFDFAFRASKTTSYSTKHLPEAHLISCLVICVKAIYPFDGITCFPRSTAEPGATAIDWGEWCKAMKEAKEEARGGRAYHSKEELTNIQEKDVFRMSNEQLDQYLDFYLTRFIDDTHLDLHNADDAFHEALYGMFPVTSNNAMQTQQQPTDLQNSKKLELVREVHRRIKGVQVVESGTGQQVPRPGTHYIAYNKSSLPEYARVFYEEAARVAGLTYEMLIQSVGAIERKIARDKSRGKHIRSNLDD